VTGIRSIVFSWNSSFLLSSTNKTDRHYIAEILLKVALNTITLTLNPKWYYIMKILSWSWSSKMQNICIFFLLKSWNFTAIKTTSWTCYKDIQLTQTFDSWYWDNSTFILLFNYFSLIYFYVNSLLLFNQQICIYKWYLFSYINSITQKYARKFYYLTFFVI